MGVVKILGVEGMNEKEPPNGPLVDPGRLDRTKVPNVLVDFDKLNHADMGDYSGNVTTLRLCYSYARTGQCRDLHFTSSSSLILLPSLTFSVL